MLVSKENIDHQFEQAQIIRRLFINIEDLIRINDLPVELEWKIKKDHPNVIKLASAIGLILVDKDTWISE